MLAQLLLAALGLSTAMSTSQAPQSFTERGVDERRKIVTELSQHLGTGQAPTKEQTHIVEAGLRDPDPYIRTSALSAVAMLAMTGRLQGVIRASGDPGLQERLQQDVVSALDDSEAEVRQVAVQAAGSQGLLSSQELIRRYKSEPNAKVRAFVVSHAAKMDDQAALGVVHSALNDASVATRQVAAYAIKSRPDPAGCNLVLGRLSARRESDASVRQVAVAAMETCKDTEAVPVLTSLAQSDDDAHVRSEAKRVAGVLATPR